MKKTLFIVAIILALIMALPVINLLRWTFQTKIPMDIIIVDKTVPTPEREEHKILTWVLTNERIVKKETKTSYSYIKDYYGFSPKRPLRDKQWDRNDYRLTDLITLADKNDAVYFTDTYGVFFNDWYKGINKSRTSRKLYGGMNNNDFLLIKEMKDRNKLIIMEYNAFDYPTAQFESVRTQEKLGIVASGWTGRYFATLDTNATDFPVWMAAMYRNKNHRHWNFTRPGIVLLRDNDIVVLEEGTHLKLPMPYIITDDQNSEKYGVCSSVAFNQSFDIIDAQANNVISQFKFETTSTGDTVLANNGLSNTFPAVTQDPVSKRIYYFSGDFSNGDAPLLTAKLKGFSKLKGILYSDKPEDTRRFFWLYYRPLITSVLSDYYNSMNATAQVTSLR